MCITVNFLRTIFTLSLSNSHNACIYTHVQTESTTDMGMFTCTHDKHTHMHTHARTHTRAHTCMHTHTHTHTTTSVDIKHMIKSSKH